MFVRTKIISGKKYGYLVESTWTKTGTRQKVKQYLGKVYVIGNLEPLEGNYSSLQDLFIRQLEVAGFEFVDKLYVREFDNAIVRVDLAKRKVFIGKRSVVVELNEGYLCTDTLKDLFSYVGRIHSEQTMSDFASALVSCGIRVSNDTFVYLYQKMFMQDLLLE